MAYSYTYPKAWPPPSFNPPQQIGVTLNPPLIIPFPTGSKTSFGSHGLYNRYRKRGGSNSHQYMNFAAPLQRPLTDMTTWEHVRKLLGFGPECQNSATRDAVGNCQCSELFEGKQCEKIICMNHGIPNLNRSACHCPDNQRYYGRHCELTQCDNNGKDIGNGSCKCIDDWYSGKFCQNYASPWVLGIVFGVLASVLVLLLILCVLCRLKSCIGGRQSKNTRHQNATSGNHHRRPTVGFPVTSTTQQRRQGHVNEESPRAQNQTNRRIAQGLTHHPHHPHRRHGTSQQNHHHRHQRQSTSTAATLSASPPSAPCWTHQYTLFNVNVPPPYTPPVDDVAIPSTSAGCIEHHNQPQVFPSVLPKTVHGAAGENNGPPPAYDDVLRHSSKYPSTLPPHQQLVENNNDLRHQLNAASNAATATLSSLPTIAATSSNYMMVHGNNDVNNDDELSETPTSSTTTPSLSITIEQEREMSSRSAVGVTSSAGGGSDSYSTASTIPINNYLLNPTSTKTPAATGAANQPPKRTATLSAKTTTHHPPLPPSSASLILANHRTVNASQHHGRTDQSSESEPFSSAATNIFSNPLLDRDLVRN